MVSVAIRKALGNTTSGELNLASRTHRDQDPALPPRQLIAPAHGKIMADRERSREAASERLTSNAARPSNV
jgi:hypothetical protein